MKNKKNKLRETEKKKRERYATTSWILSDVEKKEQS